MEKDDLKNVWKSRVDERIKLYSDKELNEIVIKSARKSMRRVYPSRVLLLVIIAVAISLIVNVTIRNTTASMRMLDLGALLLLAVSLTIWLHSFSIMKEYRAGISIKDWLQYRIKEVEKSLAFNTKYCIAICIVAGLAGLGYYYLFIWFNNIPYNPWIIGVVSVCVMIYILLSQKFVIKGYRKTLKELKKLYDQIEE